MNLQAKTLTGASMALLLAGGTAAMAMTPAEADAAKKAEGATHNENGYTVEASWHPVALGHPAEASNQEGTFAFNQEGVTPSDELFNIFGTTVTSMCSKPAEELQAESTGTADFYLNVGGNITKNFSVDISELEEDSQSALMGCSCATGDAFAQAYITGVPLASIIEMAELEDGVNTVTAYGADGFGVPLPLQYALDKNALLVYQINGEELQSPEGQSSLQLWMPSTVARYFTRNIATIELTREDSEPDVETVEARYRNKINLLNDARTADLKTGDMVTFEGVADDLGSPICAIELSFDGGKTWTVCETPDTTTDKWVNWQFETSFEEAGDYRMTARARTADGMVSPLEASLDFTVR